MSIFDWLRLAFFGGVIIGLTPLLGGYMSKVFQGQKTILHPILGPFERLSYRLAGINSDEEMGWKRYFKALFLFNLIGFIALFFLQLFQAILPLNPQKFPSIPWSLAINTATSYVTNTNWQAYAGETTMSYLTQMCGLTVQNFLSAATGMAALLTLIRGLTRRFSATIGNFWVDLTRTVIYLLLPLSIIMALVLASQGVIQSLSPYIQVSTLENRQQVIPLGPVASQVAIKQLGSNGGGFFAANSAHPFENCNALTNFLELIAILLIPAASTYMYGTWVGSKKHGWILFIAMFLLLAGGLSLAIYSESLKNPLIDITPNLEGKESRIGVLQTLLWSMSTTASANGSVNGLLSNLSPLAGGVALFNLLLGELIFGGIGVGLCSLLMFVFLTLFLSGLMVGRTPEYLGKKIEKKEVQWVSIAILVPSALILVISALISIFEPALKEFVNHGPHGLTQILYTISSTTQNNGSNMAVAADTDFYNKILTLTMFLGRMAIIFPSIAIAGSLAQKRGLILSSGVLSTNTLLFLVILLGVILIVGALTFFSALSLGPVMEHFLMLRGTSFA